MPDELDIATFQSSLKEYLDPEDKKHLKALLQAGGAGFRVEDVTGEHGPGEQWIRLCEELGLVFRTHRGGTWLWATELSRAVIE